MTQAPKINYITRKPEGFDGNRRGGGNTVSYVETIIIYLINQFSVFKILPSNNNHCSLKIPRISITYI
jgi:hypothetical protein